MAYNIRNDKIEDDSVVNESSTIDFKLPLESFMQVSIYLNDSQWKDALDEGKMWFLEEENVKKDLPSLELYSPSYKHQKTFSASMKALKFSRKGYINEFASRYARSKYGMFNKSLICKEETSGMCEVIFLCNKYEKYRSYDGSCNNLKFPFGVAFRPFRRILPADYGDGN